MREEGDNPDASYLSLTEVITVGQNAVQPCAVIPFATFLIPAQYCSTSNDAASAEEKSTPESPVDLDVDISWCEYTTFAIDNSVRLKGRGGGGREGGEKRALVRQHLACRYFTARTRNAGFAWPCSSIRI